MQAFQVVQAHRLHGLLPQGTTSIVSLILDLSYDGVGTRHAEGTIDYIGAADARVCDGAGENCTTIQSPAERIVGSYQTGSTVSECFEAIRAAGREMT